jgi:AcrR family transcriptional regulator
MPKRDEHYMESRRQEILEATGRVIARQGLAGTSTTLICREAGISMGALYTHFRSRDEIIHALTAQNTADVRDAVTFATAAEMRRKLRARLKRFTHAAFSDAIRVEVQLLAEAAASEAVQKALGVNFDASRAAMRESLRKVQEAGEIPAGTDIRAAAAVIENFMFGVLYRLAAHSAETRREQEMALDLILDGILGEIRS